MIRWITTKLGTAPHRSAQAVQGIHCLDVRELLDREGNSVELIQEVVNEGVLQLRKGRTVVVCCEHGMSRSNAIAAGILTSHEQISLETAIGKVLLATGEDSIRLDVLSTLRAAIQPQAGHVVSSKRPRVLVTGASGMIGTRLLEEPMPKEIDALLHTLSKPIDLRTEAVQLDLTVRSQGIDVIVHLAHPRIFTTNRALGEAACMMKNVLDVCRENMVKLVFMSSCDIYSGHQGTFTVDERTEPRPATTLGLTKHLCENLISAYRRQYDLRAAVLRLTTVYGGGLARPAFLCNFIEKAVRNEEIRTHHFTGGYPTVNLIHVSDVCRAIFAAVNSNSDGNFTFGSSHSVSTDEVARQVVDLTASSSCISHINVRRELCNLNVDYRRATEVYAWKPTVTLREGITQLIDAKRSNKL